jgi:hypothetical protein
MSSANLDFVHSIHTAWGRGDFGAAEWAHPEIEYELEEETFGGRGIPTASHSGCVASATACSARLCGALSRKVSAPVLENPPSLQTYKPGSWGPDAVNDLIAPRRWHLPGHRV